MRRSRRFHGTICETFSTPYTSALQPRLQLRPVRTNPSYPAPNTSWRQTACWPGLGVRRQPDGAGFPDSPVSEHLRPDCTANVELVRFRAVRGSGRAASTMWSATSPWMCGHRLGGAAEQAPRQRSSSSARTRRPLMRTTTPGRALPVSWRGRFVEPLIRHVPSVLLVPIAGECPAQLLLYSYTARVTAVKKCGWSCWVSQPEPASGAQPSVNPGAPTCRGWR